MRFFWTVKTSLHPFLLKNMNSQAWLLKQNNYALWNVNHLKFGVPPGTIPGGLGLSQFGLVFFYFLTKLFRTSIATVLGIPTFLFGWRSQLGTFLHFLKNLWIKMTGVVYENIMKLEKKKMQMTLLGVLSVDSQFYSFYCHVIWSYHHGWRTTNVWEKLAVKRLSH